MFEEVKAILARQLRVAPERVTMDAQIKKDLGADSVDILQLLMRLEDDYGIVVPDEKLANFETVGDVALRGGMGSKVRYGFCTNACDESFRKDNDHAWPY